MIRRYLHRLRQIRPSRKLLVPTAFVALLIVAAGMSLVGGSRHQVMFSYGGQTCVSRLLALPRLVRQTEQSGYLVSTQDEVTINGWPLMARQVCVEPTASPQAGQAHLLYGLYNQLTVDVPDAPRLQDEKDLNREISPTKPLEIELDAVDRIHDYQLKIANKVVDCQPKDDTLRCDISALDLAQGKKYQTTLTRSFDQQEAAEVGEGTLATLAPLKVKSSSVRDKQVRYDSPKSFEVVFDRPLASNVKPEVKLVRDDGESSDIPVKINTKGAKLVVKVKDDLPRESNYSLKVNTAEAANGSTLDAPVAIAFTTSGGPKVASVSVGSNGVPVVARIIVSLDQPISDSVNLAKLARIEGATGTVERQSSTQLAYSVTAQPCASYSLHLDKGLPSGSNSASSTEPWKFNTKAVCGSSSVIGYSYQGRPIVAHSFGSGASTVLFTGGIHGNEQSATQTMQGWVDYLYQHADTAVPAGKRVVVVPNTNPDGIAAGTRFSANGVNLGRNFPTANWKANIDTAAGVIKNGGGKTAGSEPETRALMQLTQQLRPRLEVSFHSQGYLVGANKVGDSVSIGTIYANMVGYRTMFYDAEAIMGGFTMTGEYEGWMGETMGIPAILIELPSHYGNYIDSQRAALLRMLRV